MITRSFRKQLATAFSWGSKTESGYRPRSRTESSQLAVEHLEERVVPATVFWTGAAGNGLWTEGANWQGGKIPTAIDDVLIDAVQPTTVTVPDSFNVNIKSITSEDSIILLPGASLTLTAGTSIVSGSIIINSASISVNGSGTTLQVTGSVSADDSSLAVSAGGTLSLPTLTSYSVNTGKVFGQTYSLTASGAGSVLELSNLQTISANAWSLVVQALDGGTVDFRNLTSAAASAETYAAVGMTAQGPGSMIVLSSLTTVSDLSNHQFGLSGLSATNFGELRSPFLTTLKAGITLDATGIMPIIQITSIASGFVSISGSDRDFTNLTLGTGTRFVADGVKLGISKLSSANDAGFSVKGGATLSAPLLENYSVNTGKVFGETYSFTASGAGSVLDLRNLHGVTANAWSLTVQALDGGVVDFRNLADVTGSAETFAAVGMTAQGQGSLIDLSSLLSYVDQGNHPFGLSSLSATQSGELRTPSLTQVRANLTLDDSGRMNVDSVESLTDFTIRVSGSARSFPRLINIDGTSIITTGGGRVIIPGLQHLTLNGGSQVIDASGGEVSFANLNKVTINQGTLAFSSPIRLQELIINGGELAGAGDITVTGSFQWDGGTLRGNGKIAISAVATGVIATDTIKLLGKTLVNHGRMAYAGKSLSYGPNGEAGVINNAAGASFALIGDGDIGVAGSNVGHLLTNSGKLLRYGLGDTVVAAPFSNNGQIELQQGTLNFNAGSNLRFDENSSIRTLASTAIRSTGSLGGTTRIYDAFDIAGQVVLSGGSSVAPLAVEVMGKDLGPVPAGFVRNFALGALRIEGGLARMANESVNGTGTPSEASYINRLVVDAGATLDLNGMAVYARTIENQGSIIGGTVRLIPDGGSFLLESPAFGSISTVGEVDTWSFFGRAGQRVSFTVNPGMAGSPAPSEPAMNFVQAELVDPSGNVIASSENTVAGQHVDLIFDQLPSNGNYSLRVKASPAQPTSTGNYLLIGFNSTIDSTPLILNQQVLGQLENQRSADRWIFSGVANQQVRFQFVNTSFSGVRFKLTGPNGFVGFTDLAGSSGLVTLPQNGSYTIEAYSVGNDFGSYAFQLEQISVISLQLGNVYAGVFTGPGFAQLFSFDVTVGRPLNVVLASAAASGAEVFLKLGSPPTRTNYDYLGGSFGNTQSVLVPFAATGQWYALVYSNTAPTDTTFTLRADARPLVLTDTTRKIIAGEHLFAIHGAGFVPGIQIVLITPNGGGEIPALTYSLDSTTQVTVNLNSDINQPGFYGVRVILPDGTSETLLNTLELVTENRNQIATRLIMPAALPRLGTSTILLEYANNGTTPIIAPLLTVRSSDPDGSDKPKLTLNKDLLVPGFWSGAQAEGFSDSVLIYATGASPGVMQPGEVVQVPIYYAGLTPPFVASDTQVELEIIVTSGVEVGGIGVPGTPLIDWAGMQERLRPLWISPEAWVPIYGNLQQQLGQNWAQFVRNIGEGAKYLSRLGRTVTDLSDLYSFELQQALGYSPVETIASVTDAALPTPGLDLSFGRTYATNISQRYETGIFGRGWVAQWQTRLTTENGGVVVISESAGSQRRFQPDRRVQGRYFSATGDTGILSKLADGAYQVAEANGILTKFRADGTLEYVQDNNGNRISTTFTAGRMTRLAHSNGSFLDLEYNAAGRVSSITDSAGRVKTFGYDPTNNYLLTATSIQGTITYTYETGPNAQKRHTLVTVTDQSGITRTFQYDLAGRLVSTYLGDFLNRVGYSYDAHGTIFTHGIYGESQVYLDHLGLVARRAEGLYVNFTYDSNRRLTKTTDGLGRTQSFTYTTAGSLATHTDALGFTTKFLAGGLLNQPSTFIDAKGNTTRYAYDTRGNLTATTYADGTVERTVFDAVGNPEQLVNRRGDTISRTFNVAGQLTAENYSDGTSSTYSYNGRGLLLTATNHTGTITFTYDPVTDRLMRVDYPNSRFLAYLYDPAGRRTRMTDQDGFETRYVYDPAGRLFELRDNQDALVIRYNFVQDRLVREDRSNGTFTTYEYNSNGQTTLIEHKMGGGTIFSRLEYEYDSANRTIRKTSFEGEWTYTYDLKDQIATANFVSTSPGLSDLQLTYQYDALGNFTTTSENGVVKQYATNSMNQYTSVGGTNYQYDLDGNMIRSTSNVETRAFSYNFLGQLTSASLGGLVTNYDYDPLGLRNTANNSNIRATYVSDYTGLGNVAGMYSDATASVKYQIGTMLAMIQQGNSNLLFHYDAIGSVTNTTNANAQSSQEVVYSPFGIALSGQSASQGYVGGYGVQHDNGMLYMRARFYDPNIGRFISQDPLRGAGEDPNYYRYSHNNVTNMIDPSGLISSAEYSKKAGEIATFGGTVAVIIGPYNPGAAAVVGAIAGGIAIGGIVVGYIPDDIFGTPGTGLPPYQFGPNVNDWPFFGPNGPYGPNGYSGPHPGLPGPAPGGSGGSSSSPALGGVDPNEKFGAEGFGDLAFITAGSTIPYRINFENLGPGSLPTPTRPATVPAQRVEINDQLPNNLDWTTLEFTEYGFGDFLFTIPAGRQNVFQVVEMTFNGQRFNVEVELGFNPATGLLRIVFQSVDSTTELPPDVLTGFLPPEDGTGRGQGHLAYQVRAKSNLPTGAEIRNIATIIFDGQEAIATNQIDPQNAAAGTDPNKEARNTIDNGAPNGTVLPLPATTKTTSFPVTWSGQDDSGGSGIASFDVYVSENGGAFTLWQDDVTVTTAIYTGMGGKSYQFYAVATDNVGLRQTEPNSAQASIAVELPSAALLGYSEFATGGDLGSSSTATLYNVDNTVRFSVQPYTNPAGLPYSGGVRVAVGDFTGDGIGDLVVASGPGRPGNVRVYDGVSKAVLFDINPFGTEFDLGIFIATGDITGDGKAELVISPEVGGGARLRVFTNAMGTFAQIADFIGLIGGEGVADTSFRGGARAGIGDINGDGFGDLIFAAGVGGGPRIAIFDGKNIGLNGGPKLMGDFFAFEPELRNGTYVGAGDFDGDGKADLVVGAGPGGGPRVTIFDGGALLNNQQVRMRDFFAGNVNNRSGIRIAVKKINADAFADLIVGPGPEGGSRLTGYDGLALMASSADMPVSSFSIDVPSSISGGVYVG